jgi:hypothetical protein
VNKIDIDENIIYIEDFISKEDLSLVVDAVNNNSSIEDYDHPSHLTVKINPDDKVRDIWFRYTDVLKSMLEESDRKIYLPSPGQVYFTKYRNSTLGIEDHPDNKYLMLPHQDDASYDWDEDKKGSTFVSHGIVIFITDDFDGGEIVYVNKDISIKPKAGSLLVHPGNLEYAHAVNKFSNGERVVFTAFVHEDRK